MVALLWGYNYSRPVAIAVSYTHLDVYKRQNVIYANGVPVRLMTDVGYIALSDTSYHYFIKDHQGNVRVVARLLCGVSM